MTSSIVTTNWTGSAIKRAVEHIGTKPGTFDIDFPPPFDKEAIVLGGIGRIPGSDAWIIVSKYPEIRNKPIVFVAHGSSIVFGPYRINTPNVSRPYYNAFNIQVVGNQIFVPLSYHGHGSSEASFGLARLQYKPATRAVEMVEFTNRIVDSPLLLEGAGVVQRAHDTVVGVYGKTKRPWWQSDEGVEFWQRKGKTDRVIGVDAVANKFWVNLYNDNTGNFPWMILASSHYPDPVFRPSRIYVRLELYSIKFRVGRKYKEVDAERVATKDLPVKKEGPRLHVAGTCESETHGKIECFSADERKGGVTIHHWT